MTDSHSDAQTTEQVHLEQAAFGLERSHPHYSAHRLLYPRHRLGLAITVAALIALAVPFHHVIAVAVLILANLLYLLAVGFRLFVGTRGGRVSAMLSVSDEEARSLPDSELPVYSILLPAFREPEIVAQLLRGVGSIDYPSHLLDVQLLLEQDDEATLSALEGHPLPSYVQLVLVPAAGPKTKPKACNYGLARAKGRFVTIYDAEDIPEALQLRRAVAAFAANDPSLACVQARLVYYNPRQNILTRWFSLEYTSWFSRILPGLASLGAPIPLGGTSNHLRIDVLRAVGGWDPFNVTEDAELGLRLYCEGYRSAVLDSNTAEEANSDFVNWVRQRSRWYKGYLQTGIVYLRRPKAVLDGPAGAKGVLAFLLLVPGTPILAMVNLFTWALAIVWWLGAPTFVAQLFPAFPYFLSALTLTVGNLAMIYFHVAVAVSTDNDNLVLAALGEPIYWLMMAVGALKAAIQLVTNPSYWEKTVHGLYQGHHHEP